MKTKNIIYIVLLLSLILGAFIVFAQDENTVKPEDKLVVLWTSGDREVALKMVFMYTFNSRKYNWWKDITLVVWGPSAKLLSEDKELQDYIKKIKDACVTLKACK